MERHPFVSDGFEILNGQNERILYQQNPITIPEWRPANHQPNQWKSIENYFGFFPSDDVQHLFIGTFPPQAVTFGYGQQIRFFYGSEDNLMWRIIPRITSPEAYIGIDFFNRFNIAVTDVLWETKRVRFSGNDNALKPVRYNRIDSILEDYPTITTLYFTSDSGAFTWTYETLRENQPVNFPTKKSVRGSGIPPHIFGRQVDLKFLYSPSPMATQRIYHRSKSAFYRSLCNHHGIGIGDQNNFMAQQLAEVYGCESSDIYRMFQWANSMISIPNVVSPQLRLLIEELGLFTP